MRNSLKVEFAFGLMAVTSTGMGSFSFGFIGSRNRRAMRRQSASSNEVNSVGAIIAKHASPKLSCNRYGQTSLNSAKSICSHDHVSNWLATRITSRMNSSKPL
jgi:hypothetical protein